MLDIACARQLIAAIDAGGIPLDKAIINRVAESFGLEVSRTAHTDETIMRTFMPDSSWLRGIRMNSVTSRISQGYDPVAPAVRGVPVLALQNLLQLTISG